jgi:putative flavoprotein involved in K+ transport
LIDAVIIGAGQAGLAASWHLSQAGIGHVVLERGLVGESWRSQRWDSFVLNTPNWMNRLPGERETREPRDAFLTRDAWVDHLQSYTERQRMPIRTSTEVTAVDAGPREGTFLVTTAGDGGGEVIETGHVIVASGAQRIPKVPRIAADLPPWVRQLHTADYRGPSALPAGAVLVVGGAQSGVQVVEDLLEAGRTVYLCTSAVARLRRRQRGRDSLEWLTDDGFYEVTPEQLPDPQMQFAPIFQTSGVGRHGHTVSLQYLARLGVRLLGRPVAVEGDRVLLDDSLGSNIAYADRASAELNALIERGILAAGLALPPLEPDAADEPHPDPIAVRSPDALDLVANDVSTVIWATGFGADVGYLRVPVVDERGEPIHERGAAPVPGIHFLGLRWMTRRKSALICGADDDAATLTERITASLVRR